MSEVLFTIAILAVVLVPILFLADLAAKATRQALEDDVKARRHDYEQRRAARQYREREFQHWYDSFR